MPRKQRFKPSRKPKLSPQNNEDTTMGRAASSAPVGEDGPSMHGAPPMPGESVGLERDRDAQPS